MSLRVAIIFLLLSGTSVGQDAAPIPLTGKNAASVCRGKGKDAADCVTPPHATYAPDPPYPPKELKNHYQGAVGLLLTVGTDGLPHDIAVARSVTSDFDEAAVDAVKTWRFDPAIKDGKRVPVRIKVEVTFRLRN